MTRVQQTRALARAYAKLDRATAALRDAEREFDAAYQPWAIGHVTNRDEAREALIVTGFLGTDKP